MGGAFEPRESRPIGDCAGCRWMCGAAQRAGHGACLLSSSEARCRFYGTKADWDRAARGLGQGARGGIGPETNAEKDSRGELTEIQAMRFGYARFQLASAAATIDRMARVGLPEDVGAEIRGIVESAARVEGRLYELQAAARLGLNRRRAPDRAAAEEP